MPCIASSNVSSRLKPAAPPALHPPGWHSTAEKAGLSLGKIEQMGLLSTAERLGLLTLAEDVLTSDPGKISSASLPFLVAAIASLALIPQDNLAETVIA